MEIFEKKKKNLKELVKEQIHKKKKTGCEPVKNLLECFQNQDVYKAKMGQPS